MFNSACCETLKPKNLRDNHCSYNANLRPSSRIHSYRQLRTSNDFQSHRWLRRHTRRMHHKNPHTPIPWFLSCTWGEGKGFANLDNEFSFFSHQDFSFTIELMSRESEPWPAHSKVWWQSSDRFCAGWSHLSQNCSRRIVVWFPFVRSNHQRWWPSFGHKRTCC